MNAQETLEAYIKMQDKLESLDLGFPISVDWGAGSMIIRVHSAYALGVVAENIKGDGWKLSTFYPGMSLESSMIGMFDYIGGAG